MIDPSRIPGALGLVALAQLGLRALGRRRGAGAEALHLRAGFYRHAWEDAARHAGAVLRPLSGELLEIRRGPVRVRVLQNYTPLDDPVTLRVAGDKALVHRLLAEAGVRAPRHRVCDPRSLGPARAFLREIGAACVVKPASGSGAGEGVTTGVRSEPELGWAAARAALRGGSVLVEEQLAGVDYRLLFLDGELLDVVRRDPPAVVGDGRSSLRALVRAANRERLRGGYRAAQVQVRLDGEARSTLAAQGLRPGSVPPAGVRVRVKTAVNENAAHENRAVERICPAIVELAARAAGAVGARLAGVDVIAPDISRPLEQTGGAVLEVNTCPGLYLHYHRRGGARPVARRVLELLLAEAGGAAPASRAAGAGA